MACVRRAGFASIRRAFSAMRPEQWNSASAKWLQNLDSTPLKTFQKGKSLLRSHELILSHKFYSMDASATAQIHEETPAALSEDENPELQSLNSEEEEGTLVELNKTGETPPKKKWKLADAIRETCQAFEKGDEDVEETLNQLGIHLCPQFVILILTKLDSPSSALRYFEWAKLQPGFKHTTQTYDTFGNILGRSKDFETLQRVLSERSAACCSNSAETFSFATAWYDDTDILNELMEMFEKLELSIRRDAYEMLIAALCGKNHANAALMVLEKMATAGCAPRMLTYRPLIRLYFRKNEKDKVFEIFEMMKDSPQDPMCYNLVLSVLCKSKKFALCNREKFEEVAQFLKTMVDMGCKPEAYIYNTMIQALCKVGKIDGALKFFDRLKEEGIKPLYPTYGHLLDGLLQFRGFDEAHSFLIQQCGKDRKLDTSNYNYLISACRKSGKRQEVDYLLAEKKVKEFGAS